MLQLTVVAMPTAGWTLETTSAEVGIVAGRVGTGGACGASLLETPSDKEGMATGRMGVDATGGAPPCATGTQLLAEDCGDALRTRTATTVGGSRTLR